MNTFNLLCYFSCIWKLRSELNLFVKIDKRLQRLTKESHIYWETYINRLINKAEHQQTGLPSLVWLPGLTQTLSWIMQCVSHARPNNTLTRAHRAQPIQQKLRPHPEIFSGHFSLQTSKLSSAQKQTRSENICLLLGRVAIIQRLQIYVTTAYILRIRHGQHGSTSVSSGQKPRWQEIMR